MTENWAVQVSYKVGQDMVNVRAGSAPELANILPFLPVDKIAQGRTDLDAAFAIGSAGILKTSPNTGGPVTTFQSIGPLTTHPGVNPAPSAVPEAAPVGATPGINTTVDQYGNEYTWGLPGAPVCAHGTMPLKLGPKKDGTKYKRWECVGASKAPFLAKELRCQPQYVDN